MNVLFVSPTIPYPATDGGRIRVLNLLKQLVPRVRIRLLAPRTQSSDDEGVSYLRSLGISTHLADRPGTLPCVTPRVVLRAFMHHEPITVAKYHFAEIQTLIRESIFSDPPDLVHFEMIHMAPYLSALTPPSIPTLLSLQNIDSAIWDRLASRTMSPLRRGIYRFQARQFRRYEMTIGDRFRMASCVSEQDRRLLQKTCPKLEIAIVPNGVDVEIYQPMPAREQEFSVVFTGSMDWFPNEDAVFFFVQQIWPMVLERLPGAQFYVVGQNPTKRLRQLDSRSDVTVTGRVDDVRRHIARGAVYVVPLRVGGGTRLKILEAFGMQRSVVSTTIGCEGLNVHHGENIVVCDEPESFASAVIHLLEEPHQREKLAYAGRQLVESEYDWRQIGKHLYDVYAQLSNTSR